MNKLIIIFLSILSLAGCRGKNHQQGNDRSNNEFYAEYVRIYQAYKSVPIDTTEADLKAYLIKFPNNSQAWVFMGKVYMDMMKMEKAEAAYRTALQYNAKYGSAMSGLGTIYSWDGRNDSALIWLSAAVANGDSSYYTHVNKTIIELRKNDTAAAAGEMHFFANTDSMDNDLLKYVAVISGELKNEALQQNAMAKLAKHEVKDSLLDQYLAKKIGALEFFDEKRKQLNNGK